MTREEAEAAQATAAQWSWLRTAMLTLDNVAGGALRTSRAIRALELRPSGERVANALAETDCLIAHAKAVREALAKYQEVGG